MSLPSGSMGPKVEAVCRFVEGREDGVAAIGALASASSVLAGHTGTQVRRERSTVAVRGTAQEETR